MGSDGVTLDEGFEGSDYRVPLMLVSVKRSLLISVLMQYLPCSLAMNSNAIFRVTCGMVAFP